MRQLGNGLSDAKHHKDALTVQEAELSTLRRIGTSEEDVLIMQNNLAITYHKLGRKEEATSMYRQVYSAFVKLHGEDHPRSLDAANNYALSLKSLQRFEETKSLLRSTIPVARRVLGENDDLTLRMRWNYAWALYDPRKTCKTNFTTTNILLPRPAADDLRRITLEQRRPRPRELERLPPHVGPQSVAAPHAVARERR